MQASATPTHGDRAGDDERVDELAPEEPAAGVVVGAETTSAKLRSVTAVGSGDGDSDEALRRRQRHLDDPQDRDRA